MGERFDLYTEIVATPDGKQWIVEGQCPKSGSGEAVISIRSIGGVPRWRSTATRSTDLNAQVALLARDLEAGTWPHDEHA